MHTYHIIICVYIVCLRLYLSKQTIVLFRIFFHYRPLLWALPCISIIMNLSKTRCQSFFHVPRCAPGVVTTTSDYFQRYDPFNYICRCHLYRYLDSRRRRVLVRIVSPSFSDKDLRAVTKSVTVFACSCAATGTLARQSSHGLTQRHNQSFVRRSISPVSIWISSYCSICQI